MLVPCLCLCSSQCLSLSWLICASVRPNTDRFMTPWFLATPWVSLGTRHLRSGVGSASVGHLLAFVISSVCTALECTVLQSQLKKTNWKYLNSVFVFVWNDYSHLSTLVCICCFWFVHGSLVHHIMFVQGITHSIPHCTMWHDSNVIYRAILKQCAH